MPFCCSDSSGRMWRFFRLQESGSHLSNDHAIEFGDVIDLSFLRWLFGFVSHVVFPSVVTSGAEPWIWWVGFSFDGCEIGGRQGAAAGGVQAAASAAMGN